MREISEALVRHLHAFVREVEPTIEEWQAGIKFLTDTGHMCSDTRQEFILLSDTLGVSMLVDAINHRLPKGATETTVLGPFYVEDAPELPLGADISGDMQGRPLYVEGSVSSVDGEPLAGAMVDTWHSDDDGFYDVQHLEEMGGLALRGRFRTDADGRFRFWSIVPKFYPIPYRRPGRARCWTAQGRHPYRPAHVHFMIEAPGYTAARHACLRRRRRVSRFRRGVRRQEFADPRRSRSTRPASAPDGRIIDEPYAIMRYDFVLAPARAKKRVGEAA